MPTLRTFDELYTVGQAEVQSRNPELTDWREGSVNDAYLGGACVAVDEVVRVLVALFGAQFVDTATGGDLDALAADRFGLTRTAASASVGTLTFTRDSSTGVLEIPAGTTCKATVNGESVTFTTDEAGWMAAADDTVDVRATCTATGTTGNVAADTITTIVDAIPGDSGATVTNADRFVGGAPEESDAAFRDRIRRYFGTLRKGTVSALEAGALSVAGVSYVYVDETFVAPEDGGYVAVYVGDADGRGNDALADAVTTELEAWRAAGVRVVVTAAAREEISLALVLTIGANVDQTTLAANIRAAVLAYTNSLAPGATLYTSQVVAVALAVSTSLLACSVTAPTADYAPTEPYYAVRVPESGLTVSFVAA